MNPVVGNASLIAKFGQDEHITLAEVERIRCHLEYASARLLATPTNAQRTRTMKKLQHYIAISQFPSHEDVSNHHIRKPCFIDSTGRSCAVAYLLQTGEEMQLALKINEVHQHSTIADIAADAKFGQQLTAWQMRSGLSLEELALIQPTYEFVAAGARGKFNALMSQMQSTVNNPKIQEKQKHTLARNAVAFGDNMLTAPRWTYEDTPMYLKELAKFEKELDGNIKSNSSFISRVFSEKITKSDEKSAGNNKGSVEELSNTILHQLVQLLRLEVVQGSVKEEAIYAALLSKEDFEHMKTSTCSNYRVPHH